MRVTVIDYKAGNLTSVLKALRHLGAETVVTDSDLSLVESAERIVLPGVGHFAATERLDATGLTGAIRAAVTRGVPFLGICVGMQWLYAGSTEAPNQPRPRPVRRVSARASLRALKRSLTLAGIRLIVKPGFAIAGRRRAWRVCLFHAFLQEDLVTADTAANRRSTSSRSPQPSSATT